MELQAPKSYNYLKPVLDKEFAAGKTSVVTSIWNQYRYAYLKLWLEKDGFELTEISRSATDVVRFSVARKDK